MKCPKCGKENHIGASVCVYCEETLPIDNRFRIRISKAAVASTVLAFANLGVLALLSGLGTAFPRYGGSLISVCLLTWLITTVGAMALGIIGLVQMSIGGGRLTGRGFAVIGIATPVVAATLAMWWAIAHGPRGTAFRMVCGTNLSGLAKAMLIYANDYDDELPRASGRESVWAPKITTWDGRTRQQAYGLAPDGSSGQASITACFYLLIKYAEVTPKSFLCKQDKGVSEFKPKDYGLADRELIDLWDFGPNPVVHCSYSMHMPFDKYALTTASDPGMAVAADRNPWMPSPFRNPKDKSRFGWANREQVKYGNAAQHQDEGQNVLFLDSHVGFEKGPLCGINEDNIWTHWDGGDIRRGSVPHVGQPIDVAGNRRQDSVLVTDGAGDAGK